MQEIEYLELNKREQTLDVYLESVVGIRLRLISMLLRVDLSSC